MGQVLVVPSYFPYADVDEISEADGGFLDCPCYFAWHGNLPAKHKMGAGASNDDTERVLSSDLQKLIVVWGWLFIGLLYKT